MDKFARFGDRVKDSVEHDDPRGWDKINSMLNPTRKASTISSRRKPTGRSSPVTKKVITKKQVTMVDKLK